MPDGFAARPFRTAFVFLDETGVLGAPRDPFFAVGLLKCPEPALIQRPMQALRDRESFRGEIKWHDATRGMLPVYQHVLDCFFRCPGAVFACFIADKRVTDPIARFGDQWRAYERLATQLVIGNIGPDEYVTVLADEYSTPPGVTFEESLRALAERRMRRRSILGVCRMRSIGIDTFQVLDLLLGAVAYEHKISAGILTYSAASVKCQLLDYIRAGLGITSFVGGCRNTRVNVAVYRGPQTAPVAPGGP